MARLIPPRWLLTATGVLGLMLSPVLVGYAPLTGDPELMYQPIKAELARSLSNGRLPFWSDRFGLGVPLVAESHVAAFYPLNWLFYRLWEVPTAYRVALWVHLLALRVDHLFLCAGFGNRRCRLCTSGGELHLMRLSGSARGARALLPYDALFTPLSAPVRPFYHNRAAWLAGWFGIGVGNPTDTWSLPDSNVDCCGLVLLTGGWRVLTGVRGWWQRLSRGLGILIGLFWGAAIAWVQLRLTWELTGVSGFIRPVHFLSTYSFPPALGSVCPSRGLPG